MSDVFAENHFGTRANASLDFSFREVIIAVLIWMSQSEAMTMSYNQYVLSWTAGLVTTLDFGLCLLSAVHFWSTQPRLPAGESANMDVNVARASEFTGPPAFLGGDRIDVLKGIEEACFEISNRHLSRRERQPLQTFIPEGQRFGKHWLFQKNLQFSQ
eukprot:671875-Amphidinium_carterae.1